MAAPALFCSQSKKPRPGSAGRAVYVDGPPDAAYRPGTDVLLSHWLRHAAPAAVAAETGTAMVLRWGQQAPPDVDAVVATYLVVDSVLAAWAVQHPGAAQSHADTLREAAAMADHWAWGSAPAQVLFLGVTLQLNTLAEQGTDPTDILTGCVAHVTRLLGGLGRDDTRIRDGQRLLDASVDLVASGRVERRLPTAHLATFLFPRAVHADDWARALHIPSFNAMVTDRVLQWPQARAQTDRERVHLCSYEAAGGFVHDVWYPGYAWSHTPELWRPPGIQPGTDDSHCVLEWAALDAAVATLQSEEKHNVAWMAPRKLLPFGRLGRAGRKFPVVLSCVDENGVPAPSSHSPQRVTAALAPLFP